MATLYVQDDDTAVAKTSPNPRKNVLHCWFSVSVACISVATRIDVFVFRPVLAPFALDLIFILPLDLMHFTRVDP